MQTWLSVGFDLLPQAFLFCKDELIQSDIPGNVVDNDFFFFLGYNIAQSLSDLYYCWVGR